MATPSSTLRADPGNQQGPATAAQNEQVQAVLTRLAPFVARKTEEHNEARYLQLIDTFVSTSPIRELDLAKAALAGRAVEAVLSGTEWMTAEQLGRLRDPRSRNPHAAPARWRSEGKIFGISRGGKTYYPRYAFDDEWDPLKALASVIKVFDGYSPLRLAAWFESTNSFLDGARPRERIAGDPAQVVAAAQDHLVGAVHG